MDGIQAKAQSAFQGMTAKEISKPVEDLAEGIGKLGGNIVGATVAALLQKKSNQKEQTSADIAARLKQKTKDLDRTGKDLIELPTKSVQLTIEIIKLSKQFVLAKSKDSFKDLKSKLSDALGSIKQFMFDRSKGKVNIEEEVRGTSPEQAKKLIDLLKTPEGEKAPHDFYNVTIASEGAKLLEVKNGKVEMNTIAKHMDSAVIEAAINRDTIPAVLNPNLAKISSESLTGRILAQQQSEVVNGDEIGELPTAVVTESAELNTAQFKTEVVNDLLANNQQRLEQLVRLHEIGKTDKNNLVIGNGKNQVTISATADLGNSQKYTVNRAGAEPFTFIANEDGEVIVHDVNIESIDDVLDSAELGFNGQSGSEFTPKAKSVSKPLPQLSNLANEVKNLPAGKTSFEFGDRFYQIVKDERATMISNDNGKLTIDTSGKVSATRRILTDLTAGGKNSNSMAIVAKIRADGDEVERLLSIERGAASAGDVELATGVAKQAKAEFSQISSAVGELKNIATREPAKIPTVIAADEVLETQKQELSTAKKVRVEKVVSLADLNDLPDEVEYDRPKTGLLAQLNNDAEATKLVAAERELAIAAEESLQQ
ncbi:hypothetical protein [Chamaesiphon sp.]|uniref:hypothetical protein n=1 Tax=Chamaesiphon sp. TaxID=2814140 RepID=UPI003593ACFD